MAKKIDYKSLYTLRKDGRYVGSYTDATGRHYVYDRDPERLWHKLNDPKEEAVVTFEEVAGKWEAVHREEIEIRTWKNYEPHYNKMIEKYGALPFEEVTALDASNELQIAKAHSYSATVVRTIRSMYRMIFDYAVVNGYARFNPIPSVKLPKGLKHSKRKAPTDEQMRIILKNYDVPFGLFPILLLCTGLRKSEGLSLRWSDIDFKNKVIYITKSIDYTNGSNPKYKAPKTDAGTRQVPILDMLMPFLKDARKKSNNALLFPCPPSNRGRNAGGLMTDRAYDGAWKRYCEAVGLVSNGKPTITAHNLRHGTATLMFETGVDDLTAQKVLGHSRIEITREVYTELREAQKIKNIDKLNEGVIKILASPEEGAEESTSNSA